MEWLTLLRQGNKGKLRASYHECWALIFLDCSLNYTTHTTQHRGCCLLAAPLVDQTSQLAVL